MQTIALGLGGISNNFEKPSGVSYLVPSFKCYGCRVYIMIFDANHPKWMTFVRLMPNPMMKEMDLKEITNAKVVSRMKQVLVLVAIIVIGIIISIATQTPN